MVWRMNTKNNLCCLKSLAFRLTDLCNLNCVFCGQAKQNKAEKTKNARHFLELHELMAITDQVIQYKPQVYLWGGEPLVYPQLCEFITYLRKNKLNVFITTNGVLLDKFYEFFVDNKVTQLTVSIDGFKDAHEKARGVYGIYDKIIDNLRLLNDYKLKKRRVFPLVDINVIINEGNYQQLSGFCEYLSDLGVINRIRLQLPMFFSREASCEFENFVTKTFNVKNGTSWKYFTDDYKNIDLPVLKGELNQALQNKKVQLFPPSAEVSEWFEKPNVRFQHNCRTAFERINIEPNGDLITCTDFTETTYGNALSDSIESLFNNEIINNHRKMLQEKQLELCARCSHLYIYPEAQVDNER